MRIGTRAAMGILSAVLLIGAIVCGDGCAGKKLEPGGAYSPVTTNVDGTLSFSQAPDMDLFIADSAFELGYTAMDTAFNLERNNRVLLWQASPQIKHTLDGIRPAAVEAKKKYAAARAAYLVNPIPANLDALNSVLANVRALSAAATAAVQTK